MAQSAAESNDTSIAVEEGVATTSAEVIDVPALDIPQSRPHRLSVVTAAVSRQVRNIKQATPQYPLVRYVLKQRTSTEKEKPPPRAATSVARILNRPLTALKFLGLRYIPNDTKTYCNKGYIYCCFVLLATLVNAGRLCGSYKKSDDVQVTATQILFHMFNGQVMFTLIIFVFGASPRMGRFLSRYDKYREVYSDSISIVDATRLVQRSFTGICILLLAPVVVESLSYFLLPLVTSRASRPFYDAEELSLVTAFFYVLWHMFLSFINTLPVCFIFVACRLLQLEFGAVNANFKKTLGGKPDSERLEQARFRHGCLIDVITSFDDVISPYVLLTCVTDILLLAFHASVFTFRGEHLTTNPVVFILARLISCLCVSTHLFTLLIASVTLNNTATSAKHLIKKISTLSLSDTEFQTIQMFSLTLNQEHIGLTALRLVNVDKTSSALMVLVCVSYIIILVGMNLTWLQHKCVLEGYN